MEDISGLPNFSYTLYIVSNHICSCWIYYNSTWNCTYPNRNVCPFWYASNNGWFSTCSWTFALAQLLLVPLCALIYYPFVRILDKKNLEQELSEDETLENIDSNAEIVKEA